MITYLKRYAYCAILGLVADEDDDADAACGNQVEYNNGKQAAAKPAAQSGAGSSKSGINGAQLKGFINDMNAKESIDELMAYWSSLVHEHPTLKDNEQLVGTLFQKASSLGITELEKCNTYDDIELLIQRWTDIWPATIQANTPFGNAIVNKRNTLAS